MEDISPFDYLSYFATTIICITISIVYVVGLYILSPSTYRYERNHSHVIQRRFLAVTLVCSFLYLFLKYTCNRNTNINAWLGFRTNVASVWTLILFPALLTLSLYFGPILQWIDTFEWVYFQRNWRYAFNFQNNNERLIFIRNYLVAPFTEEFVYRSSILCLFYSHISASSAIFISPLLFGFAHFHHLIEHFKQNHHEGRNQLSFLSILLIHFFQFSYTYLFGIYSAFLFIRTGHFIPSFISHALCNGLGLPDVMGLINMDRRQRVRKIVYCCSYIIGLLVFVKTLFFLTQPKFYYSNNGSSILYRHWSS